MASTTPYFFARRALGSKLLENIGYHFLNHRFIYKIIISILDGISNQMEIDYKDLLSKFPEGIFYLTYSPLKGDN